MKETEYWEDYYKQHKIPIVPSQFAAFACSEISTDATIIEIGCGNGRDAFFFARYGFQIIGIDNCPQAIASCNRLVERHNFPARFFCGDIKDITRTLNLSNYITGSQVSIYSRFFLHSITDEEEVFFVELMKNMLGKYDGKLFVEFRTDRDMTLHKETKQHFRRFIRPFDLMSRMSQAGFTADYFVEGFGYAKYLNDDAHVARIVFAR